jgi:hypothetical protein
MALIDIYNSALGRLRVKPVTNTDPLIDTSRQAKACDREFQIVRNKALTEFPWSFATQRIELEEYSEDDPAPLGVWAGRFKLFDSAQTEYNKVLKIVEVRSSANGALLDYEQTTDKDELDAYQQWIFASTTEDIIVTAVVEVTSTSEWPEYFQDVLIWRLAAAVAVELTDSVDKADRCESKAGVAMAEARLIDMGQKRQVPRMRVRPHWSPRAARMGGQLAPVEGETP